MKTTRLRLESGALLLITMNVIVILSALAAAFLVVSYSENREHIGAETRMKAFYIAEAGINDAIASLAGGGTGCIATETSPRAFSGGGYHTTSTTSAPGVHRIVAVGAFGGLKVAVEGTVSEDSGSAFYKTAAFGKSNIDFLGSPTTDSYDSSAGHWNAQASNSHGGRPYANSKGDVGSNGQIYFGLSSAVIGKATPGVGVLLSVLGLNFVDGSTAPRSSPKAIPAVQVPPSVTALPAGNLVSAAGAQLLGPGLRNLSSINLSGTAAVTLQGPSTIVCGSLQVGDTASLMIDPTNGPVYIYCSGKVNISGSAYVGSTRKMPWDTMIFASGDNSSGFLPRSDGNPLLPMTFNTNSTTVGVMYAPNGNVRTEDTANVFGSIVGNIVRPKGTSRIHYDEVLGKKNLSTGAGDIATGWPGGPIQWGPGGSGSTGGIPKLTMRLVSWRKVTSQSSGGSAGDGESSNDKK